MGNDTIGYETTSFDQTDQQTILNLNDFRSIGRDLSPSLSPRSKNDGNMKTKFGNFLYQLDAKQFPQ